MFSRAAALGWGKKTGDSMPHVPHDVAMHLLDLRT